MDLIITFLADGTLPSEAKEVERVQRRLAWLWLSKDKRMYRLSFSGPYLLCLNPKEVGNLLAELHKGIHKGHIGGSSLAHEAMI